MRLNKVNVFGIPIVTDGKYRVLEYIKKYLNKSSKPKVLSSKLASKPLVIVTPNPEQIVYSRQDLRFKELLKQADVAIPDGIGIVVAARLLKLRAQSSELKAFGKKLTGVELMEDLVKLAWKEGYIIGLIGGREGVALKCLECLQTKYPGLKGWTEEPEFKFKVQSSKFKVKDNQDQKLTTYHLQLTTNSDQTQVYFKQLASRISKNDTNMVFVGLGAPKQEYFISELRAKCIELKAQSSLVLMSVGGAFDLLSGRLRRAPKLLQSFGFEWFWRLFQEPWRWRRQLALVKFMFMVLFSRARL